MTGDVYNLMWLIVDHQMAGTVCALWFFAMIVGVFKRGYDMMLV